MICFFNYDKVHLLPLKFYLIILLITFCEYSYSQSPGNVYNPGVYSECNPSTIYKKFYSRPVNIDTLVKPLAIKGQRVWRIIDLKDIEAQKIFTSNVSCEFLDLFEVIKFGILTGKISAYNSEKFNDNVKQDKIFIKKLQTILTLKDSVVETVFDSDGNPEQVKKNIDRQLNSKDLVGYLFCEDWFFDKQWSQLDKRLVYLAPIYKNQKTQAEYPLFYLNFSECRDLLSSFKAINTRTTVSYSYDQLILSHQYPAFIIKASNVFNRKINDYKRGTDVIDEQSGSQKKLHSSESDLFDH